MNCNGCELGDAWATDDWGKWANEFNLMEKEENGEQFILALNLLRIADGFFVIKEHPLGSP